MSNRYTEEQLVGFIGDVFYVTRTKREGGFGAKVGENYRAEVTEYNRVTVNGATYTMNDDRQGLSLFTFYKFANEDKSEDDKFKELLLGGAKAEPTTDFLDELLDWRPEA